MAMAAKALWFVIACFFTTCSCANDDNINATKKQEVNEKSRFLITFSAGMKDLVMPSLFAMQDAKIHYDFDELRTMAVTMSEKDIITLENESYIEVIEKDTLIYPNQVSSGHRSLVEQIPYGVTMVQAPQAWNVGYDGTGINVCIIDSGIDADHEDLVDVPKTGYSYTDEAWSVDGCNHGTHVAGTIAATRNNDLGVVGVAPGVELIIMDVFQSLGNGRCDGAFTSTIVAAAQRCQQEGADIINMSLGGGSPSTFARNAFATLRSQGVLVIAAAGNDGTTETGYPAGYESVVSVAAIDENKNLGWFSQRNADVELAAPGVDIESTINGNQYDDFDGTSMATPHVSAVAALVWSSSLSSSLQEVLLALTQTAEDLGTTGRDNSFGYGLVQAFDAISILSSITSFPTASPTVSAAPSVSSSPSVSSPPTIYRPNNDLCQNAETLQIGIPTRGSTIDAEYDNVGNCGARNTVGGVWYIVRGNGGQLDANTCSNTGYDSSISIFEGSCDRLTCVGGNDDWCGLQSRVFWQSEADREYLILVHGWWTNRGSFDIVVDNVPTNEPTNAPTFVPTNEPTNVPTFVPTITSTNAPTNTDPPTNPPTKSGGPCPASSACKIKSDGKISKYWMRKGRRTKCIKKRRVRRLKSIGWRCTERRNSPLTQKDVDHMNIFSQGNNS